MADIIGSYERLPNDAVRAVAVAKRRELYVSTCFYQFPSQTHPIPPGARSPGPVEHGDGICGLLCRWEGHAGRAAAAAAEAFHPGRLARLTAVSEPFRNPWRVAELKQTMLSFPRKKWDFSNKTWNVKARVWTSILTVAMWVWDVGLDSRKIYNLRETGVLHPKNGVSCRYSQTNHDWDSSSVVADACIDLAEWVHLMFRWGLLPLSSFFFEQVAQPSFIRIFINQCWFKFQHLHLAFPAEMSFQSLRFSLQKHFEWVTVIFPVENNQQLRCVPFYFRTHFKRKSTVLAWFMCSCSALHSVPSGKLPIQHFRDGSTCERTTRNHVQVVSSDTFVCYKHRYYI